MIYVATDILKMKQFKNFVANPSDNVLVLWFSKSMFNLKIQETESKHAQIFRNNKIAGYWIPVTGYQIPVSVAC